MFPEIVGRVCVEAAIAAYNGKPLPVSLTTLYIVLTPQTLEQFYARTESGWQIKADTLFLVVTGITLDFGLSHTNMAEAAVKQAMSHAVRQTILLADHTVFGRESVMQIGPTRLVNKLITDNALPAEHRLELGKWGIEVIIAKT